MIQDIFKSRFNFCIRGLLESGICVKYYLSHKINTITYVDKNNEYKISMTQWHIIGVKIL